MSTLSNIHEWLTLDKAATHLTKMRGEQVLVSDLYHLAIDRKLTLSVRFLEPVSALHGKFVDQDEYFADMPDENIDGNSYDSSELCDSSVFFDTFDSSESVDDDTLFIYEDIEQNIIGIWDLTMLGWEYVDIEKRYLDALGEFGYNPERYKELGVFVRQGTLICKLLNKIEPSPAFEDKVFMGEVIRDYLYVNRIPYDECINHDFDTLAALLTPLQLDHVNTLIDFMSISFPTHKLYTSCLTIEDYRYQMVIKSQEIDRFIQSLESAPQEDKPPEQKASTKNSYKKIYNKTKTQTRNSKWQRQAIKLKKAHPSKPKTWIAAQLAKLPIADGKSADTIRKNINI